MAIPRLSQSPTDDAFVQDPYPFYAKAHARGGVFWWDEYAMPVFAKFSHISALLRDRRFGRANPMAAPLLPEMKAFNDFEALSLLERDPPDHTRLRKLVNRAFVSRNVEALIPRIEAHTRALIDEMPSNGGNLINGLCEPLPALIIAELLGIDRASVPDLVRWSHAMVAMYQFNRTAEVEADAEQATEQFIRFLNALVEERRAAPRNDLISHLIAAGKSDDQLSHDEIIATVILILNAGHEATSIALGNGIKAVLEHQMQALASDGSAPELVNEILRYDPPLHMFLRYAQQDVSVNGVDLKRGDSIALLLGAAGRDPGRHEMPDIFDPNRPDPAHLAFGAGVHFCVGAPLARLELGVALRVLFKDLPYLRIVAPPQFADRYHFHGLRALEVSWD